MKKSLTFSFAFLRNSISQESIKILNYFYPEFIISLILYFAVNYLDSYFISQISTSYYATLGVTNTLFHLLTKIGEGFSIGVVILCGQQNGIGEYKKVGRSFVDSFWITCIVGLIITSLLFFGAFWIYSIFDVPSEMVKMGIPYLRLRSISVFFSFLFFALIGFLRSLKNTKASMYIFMMGAMVFLFFDYVLIFGKLGFGEFGLKGSAIASIVQYMFMFLAALIYILFQEDLRRYSIKLFSQVNIFNVFNLLKLSWPVMLDKASFAICHIWLANRIASMVKLGSYESSEMVLASFSAIKDIERFAILPGIALAQVITFMVSNDYKTKNWDGIQANIKRVIIMSSIMVFGLLFIFSLYPKIFIQVIDKNNTFTDFAAKLIPVISVLVLFDLIQLILSAALRGAADVKTVMWTRVLAGIFFFMPLSYYFSNLNTENLFVKFTLVYGSLYFTNFLMSLVYIKRFKNNDWKEHSIGEVQ